MKIIQLFVMLTTCFLTLNCKKKQDLPTTVEKVLWQGNIVLFKKEVNTYLNLQSEELVYGEGRVGKKLWVASNNGSNITLAYSGNSNIISDQIGDLCLTQFNTYNGDTLFNYQNGHFIKPYQVITTSDSGFLVCGKQFTYKHLSDSCYAVALKFNKIGNLEWKKEYQTKNSNSVFAGVIESTKNTFLYVYRDISGSYIVESDLKGNIFKQVVKNNFNINGIKNYQNGSYITYNGIGLSIYLSDNTFFRTVYINCSEFLQFKNVSILLNRKFDNTIATISLSYQGFSITKNTIFDGKGFDKMQIHNVIPYKNDSLFILMGTFYQSNLYGYSGDVGFIMKMKEYGVTGSDATFFDFNTIIPINQDLSQSVVGAKVLDDNRMLIITSVPFSDNQFRQSTKLVWSIHDY